MMARSFGARAFVATIALAGTFGCTPPAKQGEAADLGARPTERLPSDVAHTTFVDFGGKVQIVGYDVSPQGDARPGTKVTVKLYWRRTGALEPGWSLFTHLEDDRGRQIANLDREGAFRAALGGKPEGLALLELGKIYADEQTFEMPKADVLTPTVTLVVGVWNTNRGFDQMRLPVVSGETNGHDAAIVTHFSTGVVRPRLGRVAQGAAR
jgi:hypothetical protein